MHALTSRIVIIALLLSHAYHGRAHVALDYPQGGETFIVGETILIQWHIVAPHNTLNWDLFFSMDGGETWDTLQMDIPTSQLSYEWLIPDSLTTQARIQVFQDNEGQNYLDNSMDFIIAPNTSPPVLDAPASDTMIDCNVANQQVAIEAWLNNHGGAAVTNYCSELVWSHDYPGISNECGATGSAAVTFTATDECGEVTTNATLTIVDTSPPTIDLPANDMVVESNAQVNMPELNAWLNNHGGAQATDMCGLVVWTNNFSALSDDCGLTGSATVIFTVTDQCGNINTTPATFTIVDHTSPTMQVAAQPKTISCNAMNHDTEIQQWLNDHGGAQASDISSEIIWTNDYTGLSDGCGLTGSATVSFTATDACGNGIMTTAMITIVDQTWPVMQVTARDTTIACTTINQSAEIQLWLDSHGGAQASDNCGAITWTHNYSALSDGCGSSGMANIIFTVTDECGNKSMTTAMFEVQDTIAPVIAISAKDTTIICGDHDQTTIIETWLVNHGGASASDLCGVITWTHDFLLLSDSCSSTGSHSVIFTAIDECGNETMTQATLNIIDSMITTVSNPIEFKFTVFPNPARDEINIDFGQDHLGPVYLRFFNVLGELQWSGEYSTNVVKIPIDSYSRGTYILRIRTIRGSKTIQVLLH